MSVAEQGAPAGDGARRSDERQVLVERVVILVVVVVVLAELVRVGAGISGRELAASWQLLDRDILEHDLVRGIWYLHTQPPLHNAMVGLVLWSPLPAEGTLFVLYGGCLAGIGLLVHDLARRWRVPGPAACALACVAVANPALVSTIALTSYEVPLALLLVALVAALDRHVARPSPRLLALVVGLATAIVLTRALFHPLWLAALLLLVLCARPLGRRAVAASVLVPVVAIGAVVAKNAAVVDRATLSTWTGFNLQRGIVAPMRADDVAAAIDAGAVTTLAAEAPWQDLAGYDAWIGGCRPEHDHPALAAPRKTVGDVTVPNFNHECYLGLYDQSRANALTMIRREPWRYVTTRLDALTLSFSVPTAGLDPTAPVFLGEPKRDQAWMDQLFRPLFLVQHASIDMRSWNDPLLGDRLSTRVSWTLIALTAVVTVRTALAGARLARTMLRRQRPWPGVEVVWLGAGGTVVFAIFGGDLIELGENGRFRSMLDPLLIVLTARAVVEAVDAVRAHRSHPAEPEIVAAGSAPDRPTTF